MFVKAVLSILIIAVATICMYQVYFGHIASKPKLPKEGHNIVLGPKAGWNLTDESYQFCFATDPNYEYRTTMSEAEYEIVSVVAKRAFDGGNIREVDPKPK